MVNAVLVGMAGAVVAGRGIVEVGKKVVAPVGGLTGFGEAVAVSANGDTVVVGAPGVEGLLGAAWVYVRQGDAWRVQARLEPAGVVRTVREVGFGQTVAVSADGNVVVVGGGGDAARRGAAWVFTRAGSVWRQRVKLTGGPAEVGTGVFGGVVALSATGDTIAVAAPDDRPSSKPDGAGYGAVWVFQRHGFTWLQEGPKLTGSGDSSQGIFGSALAVTGSSRTLLIGGWNADGGRGLAWIFTRHGNGWTQQAPFTGRGGLSYPGNDLYPLNFASAVALSADGTTAAVGASGQQAERGGVWVYRHTTDGWQQQGGILTTPETLPGDRQGFFGYTLAVSAHGDTALVSEVNYDHNVGAAWIFTRTHNTWASHQRLSGENEDGNASFGFALALSQDGTTAVIAGPNDNHKRGAVWIYRTSTPLP